MDRNILTVGIDNYDIEYQMEFKSDWLKDKELQVDFEHSLICAIKSYVNGNRLDNQTYEWVDEMILAWNKERNKKIGLLNNELKRINK